MARTKHFITRLCIYAFACVVAVSCKDTDDFFDNGNDSPVDEVANPFDFSTTQEVDLIVDSSAFTTSIPSSMKTKKTNILTKASNPSLPVTLSRMANMTRR